MNTHNSTPKIRIGQGIDAHALIPIQEGNIVLGGHHIACNFKIQAHSDGDLVLHALCDAILGAIAADDIGTHFPEDSNAHKGQNSADFVIHALNLATAQGFELVNVDITVIAQQPRLAQHRQAIRKSIAGIVQTSIDNISVKATTTEGLGFTGRKEGILASVVVLLSASCP